MTKFISIFAIISLFVTTFIFANVNTHKAASKPTIAHTETQNNLETYTYVITEIDESGLYGDSLTDNTGIFLTHENVKGLSLHTFDKIKVSFPNSDYETITHIEEIN